MTDIKEIKSAFKRAGHKAIHGTQFERSGRFTTDTPKEKQADMSKEKEKLFEHDNYMDAER